MATETDQVIWKDRKRHLGLPISFTRYEVSDGRFTVRKGLLRTETDELLLYRILDFKLVRTLGQKIFGVGTITLYSADQSDRTYDVKNIKNPDAVRKLLSKIVEEERARRGIIGKELFGTAGDHSMHDGGDAYVG
jgi:hypothetical protein